VTVNAVGDGGIWLDSDGTNQNGILLVLGGDGYRQGSRGGDAGNSAYWHVVTGGVPGPELDMTSGVFTPGGTYTVTVFVNGDTYEAFKDPDGIFDVNSVLLTTLVDNTFSSGYVGLYDDQPNILTGSGYGSPTTFSNFTVDGSLATTPPFTPAGTTADMILCDGTNGDDEIFDIGRNAVLASYPLAQVTLEWQIAGLGGFYGSDTTDTIWRNNNNGAFAVWTSATVNLPAMPPWVRSDWSGRFPASAISAAAPAKPTC
jgi:hypothetical protein